MNVVRVNSNFFIFFIFFLFFIFKIKTYLNHVVKIKFKKNKKRVDMYNVRDLICRHTQHGGK